MLDVAQRVHFLELVPSDQQVSAAKTSQALEARCTLSMASPPDGSTQEIRGA